MKNESDVRVVGLKPTTVGALQGTFLAIIGLVSGILYSITDVVNTAQSTNTLLEALTLGLAQGIIAIVLTPIIYFVIGWIIGCIQGIILNMIIRLSGGIVLRTDSKK